MSKTLSVWPYFFHLQLACYDQAKQLVLGTGVMGDNILTHFFSSFIAVSIWICLCSGSVSVRFTRLLCPLITCVNCSSAGRLCYVPVSTSRCAEDEADELKRRVHSEWISPNLFLIFLSHQILPSFLFFVYPSLFLAVHFNSLFLLSGGGPLLTGNCEAGSTGILQGKKIQSRKH